MNLLEMAVNQVYKEVEQSMTKGAIQPAANKAFKFLKNVKHAPTEGEIGEKLSHLAAVAGMRD